MRTFASFLFLCLFLQAAAQRECATQPYANTNRTSKNQLTFAATTVRLNGATQHQTTGITGARSEAKPTVIRIPVVIHILYNTTAQNISDAQVKSGLAALNRDFRRRNNDTTNTPTRFKAIAADVEIEFELATADPAGVATTGIVRKQTNVPAFDMDDKIKYTSQGGSDAWDSKSYLNIWLGNTRRLLGYATMPGGPENVDGIVINYTAFGTINTAAPYNLGRTVVHETGHWLGLYHIWGDQACGDDDVEDTPAQAGYTSGCPTGFRSSCGNSETGDMYMNYMDSTNDACMNLFTLGQKAKMRSLFDEDGARHSLATSKGLMLPWKEAVPLPAGNINSHTVVFQLYPNPATDEVTLQFDAPDKNVTGELWLLNATGATVKKFTTTSERHTLNLAGLKPGVYFIKGMVNKSAVYKKLVKL